MSFKVEFPESKHRALNLAAGAHLAEELTIMNSPVLFGCRTGVCGTCLVEVVSGAGLLSPPESEEQEALEVYAPGNEQARLACQICLSADIALKKLESA